jgi:hypothetical protein
VIIARSFAYAVELSVYCDVLSLYPKLPLSNHLSSGSRNIMKRYGLSMSLCMVPLCMCIGLVLPKYDPKNIVDELECFLVWSLECCLVQGLYCCLEHQISNSCT